MWVSTAFQLFWKGVWSQLRWKSFEGLGCYKVPHLTLFCLLEGLIASFWDSRFSLTSVALLLENLKRSPPCSPQSFVCRSCYLGDLSPSPQGLHLLTRRLRLPVFQRSHLPPVCSRIHLVVHRCTPRRMVDFDLLSLVLQHYMALASVPVS